MKCPHCGFNAENEPVCPVCGMAVYQEPSEPYAQQPEPYYAQQPEPYYAQQQEPYYAQQPDPYYNTQQPDPYSQQINQYVKVSARKKTGGGKAGVIIASCVLAAGILMGVIISVFSAVAYNKSAAEAFNNNRSITSTTGNAVIKFNDFIDKNSPRRVGEAVDTNWAEVTLKSVDTKKTKSGTECSFTVTVTNISNQTFKIYNGYVVNPYDSKDNFFPVTVDDASDDEPLNDVSLISVAPGQTRTIYDTVTITPETEAFYAEIDMSFTFDDSFNPVQLETGYDVDLNNPEPTTKAPER